MYVLKIELRLSDLVANPLPARPSQPATNAFNSSFLIKNTSSGTGEITQSLNTLVAVTVYGFSAQHPHTACNHP